jgi:hypothetical protein
MDGEKGLHPENMGQAGWRMEEAWIADGVEDGHVEMTSYIGMATACQSN